MALSSYCTADLRLRFSKAKSDLHMNRLTYLLLILCTTKQFETECRMDCRDEVTGRSVNNFLQKLKRLADFDVKEQK